MDNNTNYIKISEVAKQLKISRQRVYVLLDTYNIDSKVIKTNEKSSKGFRMISLENFAKLKREKRQNGRPWHKLDE